VRLTFNEAMDASTFTTADIASFTGPNGVDLRNSVIGVFVVPDSGGTQFDIRFVPLPQGALGTYSLVIGPDIRDPFGNEMDQNNNLVPGEPGVAPAGDQYRATFTIVSTTVGPDAFGYAGTVYPFEDINLEAGQPGVFTIITSADDLSVPVDLGSNTFTFYGASYTGNNQLFVSSNGLITFGSGNSSFTNTNLTTSPPQPAIAVLWDDWIKTSGSPMVLGRFDDLDGDGTPDRQIIEWNDVLNLGAGTNNGATFQVILQLNTGRVVPGDIVFNYPDLIVGNPAFDNGASATVGIKDVGTQGPNRLLVSFNSTGPFVGSGQAIRFSAPPFGGEIHGQVFNDLDQSGVNKPGGICIARPARADPCSAAWVAQLRPASCL
jgi:hypothetical protein